MSLLSGNALVTGAGKQMAVRDCKAEADLTRNTGSGIGRQLSLAYVRAGCQCITLADLSSEGVAKTEELIKGEFPHAKALCIQVDVTDEEAVNAMVAKAVQAFGTLEYGEPVFRATYLKSLAMADSILAANAAGIIVKTRGKTADVPSWDYDHVMNINARAVALCMQAEARVMVKQPRKLTSPFWSDSRRAQTGSIVNFSSVCGFVAMQNVMPYVASKHAVMGMTKSAAIEHAPDGLRINAICPGIVDTPFIANLKSLKGGNEQDPVFRSPMGRLCYPDEIADAVIFLSSTMSSYVNGVGLVSDGGRSIDF